MNPPVSRGSTILFETVEDLRNPPRPGYGRRGTQGTFALEDAVLDLEEAPDGSACRLVPSGLAAVTLAILTATGAGRHLLVSDSAYDPTRIFCDGTLKRFGVETTYYDPRIGAGIAGLIRENTQAIVLESPGSRTFEVMDVPAVVAAAQARGVTTMMDNTWASPVYFKPLSHGVDLSIQAATKFLGGHSDVLLGTVVAAPSKAGLLVKTHRQLGLCVSPDDAYLVLRGMRTLDVRMNRHWASGLALAQWLLERPEVSRVLYPPLPHDPGHALWSRDFLGASGLFGVVLKGGSEAQMDAFYNALDLFGLGFSFGGFESLLVPTKLTWERSATEWAPEGPVFRVHTGLEDVADLAQDLAGAFEAYHRAA